MTTVSFIFARKLLACDVAQVSSGEMKCGSGFANCGKFAVGVAFKTVEIYCFHIRFYY